MVVRSRRVLKSQDRRRCGRHTKNPERQRSRGSAQGAEMQNLAFGARFRQYQARVCGTVAYKEHEWAAPEYLFPVQRAGCGRERCLTPRSSGAPTAGHQARAGGTRYIFTGPGLVACRRRPLSSNVRQRKYIFPSPTTAREPEASTAIQENAAPIYSSSCLEYLSSK